MSIATLIPFGLLVSIGLIMLSLGARTSLRGALFVLRRPSLSARALAAIFVAVPAFAVLLAATLPLPPVVRFAIVAMSVGPVPPTLASKQMKSGGEADYVVGLLVAAALASMVLTPLLVAAAGRLLGTEAAVTAAQLARTLLISIGAPLSAGMLLRAVAPRVDGGFADLTQRVGFLLLLVCFVAMVVGSGREILELLGDGTALAIAACVAVGLLAGHLLGGSHRSALALAAASRHPGVALAIADLSFPDQKKPIMAAILLYLLVNLLVTAPYARWMRERAQAQEKTAAPG